MARYGGGTPSNLAPNDTNLLIQIHSLHAINKYSFNLLQFFLSTHVSTSAIINTSLCVRMCSTLPYTNLLTCLTVITIKWLPHERVVVMDGLNSPFTSCLSSIHGRTNKRGLRKSSSVESLTESFSAKRDSGQNSLLLNNSQWLAFIESMPFSLVPRSRSMSDSSLHKQGASSSADRNESNDSQGPTTSR